MCRRCETMCNEVQTCGILSANSRGFDAFVGPAFNLDMADTSCTFCGQCVAVCPTGALSEINNMHKVWAALLNMRSMWLYRSLPSVRVAIGEMFDMEPGSITTGQLATAFRRMGFNGVFDTDWAADLTIIEEASELIHRIEHGGKLPILTSCCPAWVRFFRISVSRPARYPLPHANLPDHDGYYNQNLLCRKNEHCTRRHSCGLCHAMHREKKLKCREKN